MILFEEDWNKFPSAIVHAETKNRSWLKLATIYKKMGIKNNYFHLALINPLLKDLDPHDPNLTTEQCAMMRAECELNPWYALREVIRIPAKGGGVEKGRWGEGADLEANRGNIAFYFMLFARVRTYLQQIRQTGKSLTTRVLVNLFHEFLSTPHSATQHLLYTKSDMRKEEIMEYKNIRSLLPVWVHVPHPKDADNQIEFTTMSRDVRTKSYVPAGDEAGANKVGRGCTPLLATSDEGPFCSYFHISISSMLNSMNQTIPRAIASGAFYGVAFTTTAGDTSTKEGMFVFSEIKNKSAKFNERMYDFKNRDELHKFICTVTGQESPSVDITFNHLQLGYSNAWLRAAISRVPSTKDQIKRDQLNIWTQGGIENPINSNVLAKIKKSVKDPKIITLDNHPIMIRTYPSDKPLDERYIVAGVDLSNAIDKDNITIVGVDVQTGETAFAVTVNNYNLIRFAEFLMDLLIKLPRLTLIPENKSQWTTIIGWLIINLPMKGIDPGRRIYSTVVNESLGSDHDRNVYKSFSSGYPTEAKYNGFINSFGFMTTGVSRDNLYVKVLKDATLLSCDSVYDLTLTDELADLKTKKGRVDHANGGHDDHVISWLMANWMLREGRNLNHYGIDPTIVFNKVISQDIKGDPDKLAKLERRKRLEEEYADFRKLLDEAKSIIEVQYYSQRLVNIEKQLGALGVVSSASMDKQSVNNRNNRNNRSSTMARSSFYSDLRKTIWGR